MKEFLYKEKNKILIFLGLITSISFLDTIRKGLLNGCDFQWHPSKLFWNGINHYEKFLNQGNFDFLCQGGQYAHGLQIVLLPYAQLEWETARIFWVITNVIFAFMIPLLICKKFNISKYKTVLILMIFLTCYPTRMTINYGQQSLFVFFFLILPFIYKSNVNSFLSGLSIFKYSTGYVIFLYFLVKKKYKNFVLATIPYFLGWIIYFLYTKSDPIKNFFEPLQWVLKSGYARDGDIYSILNNYFFSDLEYYFRFLLALLMFGLNILFLIRTVKIKNDLLLMGLVSLCPLIFLPHSNYDYVLLLPLLVYAFTNLNLLINKINLYFVIYYFFINRIVKHQLDIDYIYQPIMLVLMIFIFFSNIHFYKDKTI
tara:strand:- start:2152 stop:3258 length:1107 start_codon:yes stop_codon:yes gene_type:complete